jgi:transposase
MITRNLGIKISGSKIKRLKKEEIRQMFDSPYLVMMAEKQLETIHFLQTITSQIEKEVKSKIKLAKEFQMLITIPGIGDILALTIMLEVGDISRFEKVGCYSSYCRCVASQRRSNDKKKGEGNRKNGNKYLAWAYIEAANFSRRYCQEAQRFYQRKVAKTNAVIATKALANKLARSSYYIMRDQVPFDKKRLYT